MKDKQIEIKRYDKRAQEVLNKKKYDYRILDYLNSPYEYYFKQLRKLDKKKKLLEIGAGMGENTSELIKMSFNVCATDLSSKSVKFMSKKFSKNKNFSTKIADMEKLPFNNESFDIICSAGSLSYGDNNKVMNELYRVLKIGGSLIFVDSLNDNPIYRINRYINYIRGDRSKSTLRHIPDINLIDKYIAKFGDGKVKYFGSITWTFPLLKLIFKEKFVTKISNWVDKKLKINKSAFKCVLTCIKRNK